MQTNLINNYRKFHKEQLPFPEIAVFVVVRFQPHPVHDT